MEEAPVALKGAQVIQQIHQGGGRMDGMEGDDPAIPGPVDGLEQAGEHGYLMLLRPLALTGEVKPYLSDEGGISQEGFEVR